MTMQQPEMQVLWHFPAQMRGFRGEFYSAQSFSAALDTEKIFELMDDTFYVLRKLAGAVDITVNDQIICRISNYAGEPATIEDGTGTVVFNSAKRSNGTYAPLDRNRFNHALIKAIDFFNATAKKSPQQEGEQK